MGPAVKRAACSGLGVGQLGRWRPWRRFARETQDGRSKALIAWMPRFFERGEGVKGGFAAAWRFTLDALAAFKHDNPSDQGLTSKCSQAMARGCAAE